MSATTASTVYLFGAHCHQRTVFERAPTPLFCAHVLAWITAETVHFAIVDGANALRFAMALAGLQFSRNASSVAA